MANGTTFRNGAVLSCWKDISNYLGKSVRTVQRWERIYGLPVRRLNGRTQKGAVIAYTSDLDAWLESSLGDRDSQQGRMTASAADKRESVSDLVQITAELRSRHHEVMLQTNTALATLSALCARLESIRLSPWERDLRAEVSATEQAEQTGLDFEIAV